jgi:hypothetical protein
MKYEVCKIASDCMSSVVKRCHHLMHFEKTSTAKKNYYLELIDLILVVVSISAFFETFLSIQ